MPCTVKKLLLLALLLLLAAKPAIAEENVTELKIESITTPIRAGERLEFTFLVGNRLGPPCSGQIQYWFEVDGERLVQGNDNVYLETSEAKVESASLIMPPGLEGVRDFYLEMKCNDTTVIASRVIHIATGLPGLPQFKSLDIIEEDEGQTVFSYTLESGQGETVPVHVEEWIVEDNNVLWTSSQNLAITGSSSFKRFGPVLPPGSYKVIVEITAGEETARIVREFTVGTAVAPPLNLMLLFSLVALAILAFATIFVAGRFASIKDYANRYVVLPVSRNIVLPTLGEHEAAGKPAEEIKQIACPVEAEESGIPDEFEVSQMLEGAGLESKRRQKCLETAGKIPIVQIVKGCVITDKSDRMRCETTVTITVANNTNRNWENIVFFARVPEFFAEDLSEVEADCKIHPVEGTSILKFRMPKVGAMQSASVSYKTAKMISQAEANSIPLPAVVSYKQGKPLVIAQVKVEKKAEEAEKEAAVQEAKEKATKKAVAENGEKKMQK